LISSERRRFGGLCLQVDASRGHAAGLYQEPLPVEGKIDGLETLKQGL